MATFAGERSLGETVWIARLARSTRPLSAAHDRRFGWTVWAVFLLATCFWITVGPPRSVTPAYFFGAHQWLAGLPLYDAEGVGFLYLPQAAILFVPFTAFPTPVADVLWRVVSLGLFAWGVRRLTALVESDSLGPVFGMASLLAVPLAFSSAKGGQATLPMAGLMMAAVAYLATRSWWRAAGCLTLAIAFKPLAIVLLLLAVALYRPLIGRSLVAVAIMLAAPYLTQSPAYVQSQYVAFVAAMQSADHHSHIAYYAQLFGLLRVVGWEFSGLGETVCRVVFAVLTLLVCLWYQRKVETGRWAIYLYALSTCYLMLFNPRTENNSYSMLGPMFGLSLAWAIRQQRQMRTILLAVIVVFTLGTFEIGRWITPEPQSIWLAPLMCIGYCLCLLADLRREATSPAGQVAVATAAPAPDYGP